MPQTVEDIQNERLLLLESELLVLRNMMNLISANINHQASINNEHHLRQAKLSGKVDVLENEIKTLKE